MGGLFQFSRHNEDISIGQKRLVDDYIHGNIIQTNFYFPIYILDSRKINTNKFIL